MRVNSTLSAWWPKKLEVSGMQVVQHLRFQSPGFKWRINNNLRSTCEASTGCLYFLCATSVVLCIQSVFNFNQFLFESHRFTPLKTFSGAPSSTVIVLKWWLLQNSKLLTHFCRTMTPTHKFTGKIAQTTGDKAKPKANRLTVVIHIRCIGISRSVAERLSNFLQNNSENRNLQFYDFVLSQNPLLVVDIGIFSVSIEADQLILRHRKNDLLWTESNYNRSRQPEIYLKSSVSRNDIAVNLIARKLSQWSALIHEKESKQSELSSAIDFVRLPIRKHSILPTFQSNLRSKLYKT